MATKTATTAAATSPALSPAVLDKYKDAGKLTQKAIEEIVKLCVDGAVILDICKAGDAKIESEAEKVYNNKKGDKIAKGIAYPTCINVNNVLINYSPMPSDKDHSTATLKAGDLVKIQVGAHIDGYAAIAGESLVVGGDASDAKADLIQAAYQATEIALRSVKPGLKNWEVTQGIAKVLDEYKEKTKVRGVEGAASSTSSFGWRIDKDDIQAKKTIIPFPTSEQRRDSDNSHNLEEGEVYAVTIAVTNAAENKAKDSTVHPTSIYCRLPTSYQLKMKASREVYSEIVKKAGAFPFPLRILENETRAKLAVRECVQHALIKPFDVQLLPGDADLVASFTVTFAVTKTGAARLSLPPTWYSADKVKSSVEIANEETKSLLTKSLKPPKKKTDKKAKDGNEEKN